MGWDADFEQVRFHSLVREIDEVQFELGDVRDVDRSAVIKRDSFELRWLAFCCERARAQHEMRAQRYVQESVVEEDQENRRVVLCGFDKNQFFDLFLRVRNGYCECCTKEST